jgi:hypothetical protein
MIELEVMFLEKKQEFKSQSYTKREAITMM